MPTLHTNVPGILPDLALGPCALLDLKIRPRAHSEAAAAGLESISQTRDNIDGLAFCSWSTVHIWGTGSSALVGLHT